MFDLEIIILMYLVYVYEMILLNKMLCIFVDILKSKIYEMYIYVF